VSVRDAPLVFEDHDEQTLKRHAAKHKINSTTTTTTTTTYLNLVSNQQATGSHETSVGVGMSVVVDVVVAIVRIVRRIVVHVLCVFHSVRFLPLVLTHRSKLCKRRLSIDIL
jgi:hypothetical protein